MRESGDLRWRFFQAAAFCCVALFSTSTGAAQEVSEAALRRNCLDNGTADHPLSGAAFEACLRKKIENLPPLDRNRRELFGERYDPQQYVKCRLQPTGRNNSACDVYILRRQTWPEYWPEDRTPIAWSTRPAVVY